MRRGRCGFTLIEVLVALVIVAAGMSALMGALSSSARAVSYMRDKTFAQWVALNQIATFRLQLQPGQIPSAGSTNGDIDYAGRSWHWRQDIIATQVQGMMRIDVKVRPKEVKAGDDDGWYVTLSGLTDDALAPAGTYSIGPQSPWDALPSSGQNGAAGQNTGTTLNGTQTNRTNTGTQPGTSGSGTAPTTGTAPTPAPIPTPNPNGS